jgi:hypothetical protein
MMPKLYNSKPDTDMRPWNHGNVPDSDLTRWHPDNDTIYIRGVQVYRLVFEIRPGILRRWNCRMGWEEKGML